VNRRFTDEMLALILLSRTRKIRKERKRMEELKRRDGDGQYAGDRPPRFVSHSEFFAPMLTPTLANPNALRFKRIQVVA
jgi:hypothetical protein